MRYATAVAAIRPWPDLPAFWFPRFAPPEGRGFGGYVRHKIAAFADYLRRDTITGVKWSFAG